MLWERINLTDWRTKEKILRELKLRGIQINERLFRLEVEKQNELYAEHQSKVFIAHSSKGYKIAINEDEIRYSARDYRARAMDQLVKYSKIMKALGENGNMKIEIKDNEMFVEGV